MRVESQKRRIALVVSYDGTAYKGWQRQRNAPSIQEEIEICLSTMTNEEVCLHGAGRTDAGVHALAMVAHFSCYSSIACHNFVSGLNSMLPSSIRILEAKETDQCFHARFSAKAKRYRYCLYNGQIQPPMERLYAYHVKQELNIEKIRSCLPYLIGCHDFSSFENSGTRDKNCQTGRGAVRTIYSAKLFEDPPARVSLELVGDGFLKNMVRNIVGTLLQAGQGKLSAENFSQILEAKDRKQAGWTAPAHGLTLVQVYYDDPLL